MTAFILTILVLLLSAVMSIIEYTYYRIKYELKQLWQEAYINYRGITHDQY